MDLSHVLSYITNIHKKYNYHPSHHHASLFMTDPLSYDKIPYYPHVKGLERFTVPAIESYFDTISLKIMYMSYDMFDENSHLCDSCNTSLSDVIYSRHSAFSDGKYTGPTCHRICAICFIDPDMRNYRCIPWNRGMGSIFNWIPIYRDADGNCILYNPAHGLTSVDVDVGTLIECILSHKGISYPIKKEMMERGMEINFEEM